MKGLIVFTLSNRRAILVSSSQLKSVHSSVKNRHIIKFNFMIKICSDRNILCPWWKEDVNENFTSSLRISRKRIRKLYVCETNCIVGAKIK